MAGQLSTNSTDHAHALARQVRKLRETRGWSREHLAIEAGISLSTLARLESQSVAQPGFFTVGAVAEALNVSLDDLFRSTRTNPGLWSAGYEGRDIDSFVASLLDHGIDMVADVRLTPISRKPGFSKSRLGEALSQAGIQYTHLRALGNPKDNRAPFWDGRVNVGQARFRDILRSAEAQSDLNRLTEQAVQSRVAVLCFEKDEERCHRKVVLDTVRERIVVEVQSLS
ncbi:DUF488 family protein [Streptosporangium saharense]|uniref:Transcriptional regulator with XRE-family HTH domain n=1 Tax=Streptosporangium saharense TaxID=1706840 RepID=A0A7W7VJZ8_9ACTN|nr:DUF488 family protein [Streptosporangium saharense]MBB4913048.1 transcriptional regulator with XRE-family HTH domain [Streptosporangium saharense]